MERSYTPLRIIPGRAVVALDQTALPHDERYIELRTVDGVCEAICELRVRGAPLLGLVGACGMAIAAMDRGTGDDDLQAAMQQVNATRPTAADLGAALRRAFDLALAAPPEDRSAALWRHAEAVLSERIAEDESIADHGAPMLEAGWSVLTHCNTGALATGGSGTALAVIARARDKGRLERCYTTETRPLLQGARLTAWELQKLGIPGTLLPDTAAASLLASGQVQAVVTGADRIAANGDTANKIGTYALALAAARHNVPFFVAAPVTTIDASCPRGDAIPIEFRRESEVGGFAGQRWAPEGLNAYNPAFDVTPAELVSAIVTNHGVLRPPFNEAIRRLG